jgi:Tol biopolymer transport system component
MIELQKFEGYTIDERLREFRKVYRKDGNFAIEFIPFWSAKGKKLLKKLRGVV